jgi:hypothetical protein
MTLKFTDETIISDHTPHVARLAPGDQHTWEVSWLPGRSINRNTAITAMVLADVIGSHHLHAGHRLWPHIEGWAAELDLTAPDALTMASQPPGRVSPEKDSTAIPSDPEAAG